MLEENNNAKTQNILWWIASIATSVLCCSVLFILFAGYINDIKTSLELTGAQISVIRAREDKILAEIEMIHKKMVKETAETGEPEASPAAVGVPVGSPPAAIPGAGSTMQEKMPEIVPPSAPTSLIPPAASSSVSVPTTVNSAVPATVAAPASVSAPAAPASLPATPVPTVKK